MEVIRLAPPLRVLLCNLKGGPGKTTSTWFLSTAFSALGLSTVAVDADLGSNSLSSWYTRAVRAGDHVPFTVEEWHGTERDGGLSKFCKALEDKYQPSVVIVDTGGERREVFMSACLYADRLLMPVGPSLPEIERLRATRNYAAEVAQASPIAVSALLTRVSNAGVGLARDARQLIEDEAPSDANDHDPYALHVMTTEIVQNRHRYSVPFGQVTVDTGEYAALAQELLNERKGDQ
jgi:chromosome partitioning protein